MKDIAILTLYASSSGNYGQLLQGYSTYRFLADLGHNPVILNFIDPVYSPETKLVKNIDSIWIRSIFYKARVWVWGKKYKRVLVLESFIENNVKMTEPCFSQRQIEEALAGIHTYVCGSDTCWYKGSTNAMFLGFAGADDNKIAFSASSLNSHITPSNQTWWDEIIKDIKRFDFISVRESVLKNTLNSRGVDSVNVTLDPVFLLDKPEWEKLAMKGKRHDKKYVLFYFMGSFKERIQLINSIKEKYTDSEIVIIRMMQNRKEIVDGCMYVNNASVEQFLNYIQNAEAILTDSFHGAAFSIIFQKNFYVVRRNHKRIMFERLRDLLLRLGLDNREAFSRIDTFSDVNYEIVNEKLDNERRKTKEYLMNAIKSDGEY